MLKRDRGPDSDKIHVLKRTSDTKNSYNEHGKGSTGDTDDIQDQMSQLNNSGIYRKQLKRNSNEKHRTELKNTSRTHQWT